MIIGVLARNPNPSLAAQFTVGCGISIHLHSGDGRGIALYGRAMQGQDDIRTRIERFNQSRGGGVVVERRKGGYTLLLEETGAPIARLKPVDQTDRMRVLYWSHRDGWDDVGPFGGIILSLDKALEFIAREPVFWNWS